MILLLKLVQWNRFPNQPLFYFIVTKGPGKTSFKEQQYPSSSRNLLLQTARHFIHQNIYTYGETKAAYIHCNNKIASAA